MDAYFKRMKGFSTNSALSSRIRYMLQDVIDLRNNKWVSLKDKPTDKKTAAASSEASRYPTTVENGDKL